MPASLSEMEYDEVSLVDSGANQDAHVALFKRDFTAGQRKKAAQKGNALPDGSFPINNSADLKNAVQAIGRAKNPEEAKAHIIQRAKALGCMDLLPKDWNVSKGDKPGHPFHGNQWKKINSHKNTHTYRHTDGHEYEIHHDVGEKRSVSFYNAKTGHTKWLGTHENLAAAKAAMVEHENKRVKRIKKSEGDMADVVKRKMSCADCGKVMSSGMDACPECDSKNIKKSLVIVRKSSEEEELNIDDLPEVTDTTDDESDDEEQEGVVEEEDDESGEDDDQEDEGDEEEVGDEPESPTPVEVPEEVVGKASEETLDLTYALSKSIRDILTKDGINKADAYEQVMVEFNSALDQAAEHWFAGSYVSKSATPSAERVARLTAMHEELSSIIGKKEGGTVTGLSDEVRKGLDNDVLAYIADLESKAGVSKSEEDEIFKGLSPAAVELVKSAQKTADEAKAELAKREDQEKTREYIAKASGYTHLPIKSEEFGPVLKSIAGALSEEDYGKLEQVLSAANYNLAQSNVFKSFGSSRNGAGAGDAISKLEAEAKAAVSAGTYPTIEQAQAALLRQNPSLYDAAIAEGGAR